MAVHYGFDTAAHISSSLASAAESKFGNASFWIRYFSPSQQASVMNSSSSNAISECRALWDSGARYLVPIQEYSPQSRITGTYAAGKADATTFCNAIKNVYYWVSPLFVPSSTGRVDVYMGTEDIYNLSADYWAGWATYVDGFYLPGGGVTYPLYPGLYCNPASPKKNCSSIRDSGIYGWSIWSDHPEPCAACGRFGSVSWRPYNCSDYCSCPYPTHLWQMAQEHGCESTCNRGSYPNVDADESTPSRNEHDHMFYLGYRP